MDSSINNYDGSRFRQNQRELDEERAPKQLKHEPEQQMSSRAKVEAEMKRWEREQ